MAEVDSGLRRSSLSWEQGPDSEDTAAFHGQAAMLGDVGPTSSSIAIPTGPGDLVTPADLSRVLLSIPGFGRRRGGLLQR